MAARLPTFFNKFAVQWVYYYWSIAIGHEIYFVPFFCLKGWIFEKAASHSHNIERG